MLKFSHQAVCAVLQGKIFVFDTARPHNEMILMIEPSASCDEALQYEKLDCLCCRLSMSTVMRCSNKCIRSYKAFCLMQASPTVRRTLKQPKTFNTTSLENLNEFTSSTFLGEDTLKQESALHSRNAISTGSVVSVDKQDETAACAVHVNQFIYDDSHFNELSISEALKR